MPEIGPEHPLTYRQEIAEPIFARILAGGSGAVVGAASAGKSRLLQFILRPDVRRHYLGETAKSTMLVWVDCNRMAEISEWGLYELMLTALAEAVPPDGRAPLLDLRREAIVTHNALLAQRNVEMALRMLCQEEELRVALILDEFDACYQALSGQTLANLRALRDMNKYALGYVMFLRHDPATLRDPDECEGFYELFSRNVMGLQPYAEADALRIVDQLLARRGHELPALPKDVGAHLYRLSGGHSGLLVALIQALVGDLPTGQTWDAWAQRLPTVHEECRKLWNGLLDEERRVFNHLAQGMSTRLQDRKSLLLKGLLTDAGRGDVRFFSPLFRHYVANQAPSRGKTLHLDAAAQTVWIEGQPPVALTAKEYALLAYLYTHLEEIRSHEDIIAAVYPDDEQFGGHDGALAALVSRLRQKIEQNPSQPQYLLNFRGRGYMLVSEPHLQEV